MMGEIPPSIQKSHNKLRPEMGDKHLLMPRLANRSRQCICVSELQPGARKEASWGTRTLVLKQLNHPGSQKMPSHLDMLFG